MRNHPPTVSQGARLRAVLPSSAHGCFCSVGHPSSQQEGEELGGANKRGLRAGPGSGKHHFCSGASGENLDTAGTCQHRRWEMQYS